MFVINEFVKHKFVITEFDCINIRRNINQKKFKIEFYNLNLTHLGYRSKKLQRLALR